MIVLGKCQEVGERTRFNVVNDGHKHEFALEDDRNDTCEDAFSFTVSKRFTALGRPAGMVRFAQVAEVETAVGTSLSESFPSCLKRCG